MTTCANPASWHPTLHTIQRHHHPPLSWRDKLRAANPAVDQSWWKVVPLCGIDHDEVHALLDAHVRFHGVPPWALRRTYSVFARKLAAECWASRPSDSPPYTLGA